MRKDIEVQKRKLSEILYNHRYKIDVFQREYKWQDPQIEALLNDLTTCFYKSYVEGDTISSYEDYDTYFMGSIVLCKDSRKNLSIVDGQQRLTTFSLLLIYLSHLQDELDIPADSRKNMRDYLYIVKGGERSLILNIESRTDVMNYLVASSGETYDFDSSSQIESVRNIVKGYDTIKRLFPQDLITVERLPLFIEWLLDNVQMVEILTEDMDNAYTIFETMNDRGLNLRPAEILKGYLLSKIIEDHDAINEERAEEANNFWTQRLEDLQMRNHINESDFFRAWLRAKYAVTQRSSKSGSQNEDFEKIGTNFHSWVKDNTTRMKLKTSEDYYFLIRSDFDFFSTLYTNICKYKNSETEGFKTLYLNNFYTIADSLLYPLLMASVSKIDDEDVIKEKINIGASFIDKLANIRTLQNRTITQTSLRNTIYELVKKIRNVGSSQLRELLQDELNKVIEKGDVYRTMKEMNNGNYYHYFFARLWSYLDNSLTFSELLRSRKQSSYVLVPLFNEKDFGNNPDMETYTYILINSVANYCLMRRKTAKDYEKISTIGEKLSFLGENVEFPELVGVSINNPHSLIEDRDSAIKNIAEKMWSVVL